MVSTFLDLLQGLIKDNHPDLALNALHKYDAVLPDINPAVDVAYRKMYIGKLAYDLHDLALGTKIMNSTDNYITDQLDYNYKFLQDNSGNLNVRDVQIGISCINNMAGITEDNHQTALSNKLKAQLKDYETKFGSILQRQQ